MVREGNVIVTGVVDDLPISVEDEDVTNAVLVEIHNTAVTSDIGDPKTFLMLKVLGEVHCGV